MSQNSLFKAFLIGVRCAGAPTYYPAHINPLTGAQVNARAEASFYKNSSWVDGQGNRQEKQTVIRITFWNGRNASPGKGMADTVAKYVCAGKLIDVVLDDMDDYDARVFDASNQAVAYADGTLLTTKKHSFKAEPGTLRLGDDSEKRIQNEIAAFQANGGMTTFDSRPADWNHQGTAGHNQWQGIMAWRTSQVFQPGMQVYGHAKVGQVKGAPIGAGQYQATGQYQTAPIPAAHPTPVQHATPNAYVPQQVTLGMPAPGVSAMGNVHTGAPIASGPQIHTPAFYPAPAQVHTAAPVSY